MEPLSLIITITATRASLVSQLVRICLQCGRPQFNSWVRKIPWRRDSLPYPLQYYWASLVAQIVKNPPAMWGETWIRSLGWEDPLVVGMATHFSILCLENPHGQKRWVGYSPWGHKESDMIERLSPAQHSIHSGILLSHQSNLDGPRDYHTK